MRIKMPSHRETQEQKLCGMGTHAWRWLKGVSDQDANAHTVWMDCYWPGCNAKKTVLFPYFIRRYMRRENKDGKRVMEATA